MTTSQKISAILPLHISENNKSNGTELVDILFSSLIKFAPKKIFHTFYIVCPEEQVHTLLQYSKKWPDLPLKVISEDSLVPDFSNYPTVGGWRKQQIIKLAIAKLIATPFYLTFDADIICTSHFSQEILIPNDKALLQKQERLTRSWWWTSSASYLKTPPNVSTFGMDVTPAILSTHVCMELIKALDKTKKDWLHSLLAPHRKYAWQRILPWYKKRYSWTEYSLYYLFLEKNNMIEDYHIICGQDVPQRLLSNKNSVWNSTPFESWDPAFVFSSQDPGLFCVVQSNKNIAPKNVWKRVEKYIT